MRYAHPRYGIKQIFGVKEKSRNKDMSYENWIWVIIRYENWIMSDA